MRRDWSTLPLASGLAALVPAGLTLFLGFHSGGFFPGATSLAAAELAILVALGVAVARRPFAGMSAPLTIAAVAMAALTAWTLMSAGWSDSMARALPEYTRALLYGLVLLLFGLMPFDARRVRWMLYGLAAAIVAICAAAIVARTLPHLIFDPALVEEHRLGYPLTYWNALGLLAGIGIVLCGHLACSTRDPRPVRVLGATAVPLLTLTLLYTLSRGGTWAAIAAVVVYVLLGRPRGLVSGAIATVPTTLAILVIANPTNVLAEGYPWGSAALAAGKHVAICLVVCMAAAAVLRAALLPLDAWMAGFRLPSSARRPVFAGSAVAAIALVLAASVALNLPGVVQAKYDQFASRSDASPSGGGNRLFSASTNGRKEHWAVALDAFKRDPLHGSGAGTFGLLWAKGRSGTVHVEDAHSLYIETLGELGLPGLVLLLVVLISILVALAYRARGPNRALFAALFAAALGWALAAGVDWDWEMPATTVWLFAFGGAALARSARAGEAAGRARRIGAIAIRAAAVAAALALAVTPARVAIAAGRFDAALSTFLEGDCRKAKAQARDTLSVLSDRVAPYELIAFCDMRERRYGGALAAIRQARRRDPHNWELYYGLAVARAANGLDPAAAAARAAALDPHDPNAGSAPRTLAGSTRGAWIAAGRKAVLLPPVSEDP